MRVTLVILIALAGTTAARADDVGVLVTGDPSMQPEVATHVERWLTRHGDSAVASPMSPDAINTLVNCLVIDDQKCARGVIEARSKARSLVFTRVDVATKGARDITLTAYWFVKGHAAISERRVCEHCTEDSWHGVIDAMLGALASGIQADLGRVKITSKPTGMIVFLDSVQIGVTPLERDVSIGSHRIELTHGGRNVGTRELDVTAGETSSVVVKVDDGRSSRIGPAILLGAGIAMLGAGGVYLYYGALGGTTQKYIYPDSTPVGIGLLAVGLGATIGGTVLLSQSGQRSTPVASIGPGGGYVGWLTRF